MKQNQSFDVLKGNIAQLEAQIIHAIQSAEFYNDLVLFRVEDVMDAERVDENNILFDTVALVGKVAHLVVEGVEITAFYNQTIRMNCNCNDSEMKSILLDQDFFNEVFGERRWTLLIQNPFANFEPNTENFFEYKDRVLLEVQLQTKAHLNEALEPVAQALQFPLMREINMFLDQAKHTIYRKTKETLYGSLD